MEGAAAAGETTTMKSRMRISVLAMALALSLVVAPAHAWPGADNADRPAVSWWDTLVEALATLFGLDEAVSPPTNTPQGDGSCMIDPQGGCRS